MLYNIAFAYGFDGLSFSLPDIPKPSLADRAGLTQILNCKIHSISFAAICSDMRAPTGCSSAS